MKRLENWLAAEKQRQLRRPRLEDALFSRRPIAYVAYRLRFVTLRVVLRTALHLIEVVALSQFLLPKALVPILLLRHISIFAQTLWWGALEPQRIALREAHRKRDEGAYASISSRWALLAAVVATAELGLTGLWFLVPTHTGGAQAIYGSYAVACGWRLCLDTWSRTQHSAVYAVSRVQRPLWSLVLVDFLEVFGLLWAWLRVGPIALAIVLAASGTLRCILSLYFTERTRRQVELPRRSRSVWRELVRGGIPSLPWLQLLKFAGLNASLQVESVIIMVLGLGLDGEAAAVLSMTIHSFSPLLGAGYSWARVFYFDFKRIEGFGEPFFARRMGRLLDRVALTYPPLLVALVLPVANLLAPELVPDGPVPIALFVMARSLFAIRQIEAFGYVDTRTQMRQSLILASTLGAISLLAPRLHWFFYAVVAAFLVAAVGGPRARLSRRLGEGGQVLGLEAWLEWLRSSTNRWRIVTLGVDRSTATLPEIRRVLLTSGHKNPLVRTGQSHWVTLAHADTPESAVRARLIEACGGALSSLTISSPIDSSNLLGGLRESRLVSETISSGLVAEARRSNVCADLEWQFLRLFPGGRCLSPHSGSLARLDHCDGATMPHILHTVLSGRTGAHPRDPKFTVITYRPQGKLVRIFLIPGDGKMRSELREFETRVRHAAIGETVRLGLNLKPIDPESSPG